MVLITQERGDGFTTGLATATGKEIIIVTTPSGMYKLSVRGAPGLQPAVTNDTFTSLSQAKAAAEKWHRTLLPQIRKREIHDEAIERRKAENGEG